MVATFFQSSRVVRLKVLTQTLDVELILGKIHERRGKRDGGIYNMLISMITYLFILVESILGSGHKCFKC